MGKNQKKNSKTFSLTDFIGTTKPPEIADLPTAPRDVVEQPNRYTNYNRSSNEGRADTSSNWGHDRVSTYESRGIDRNYQTRDGRSYNRNDDRSGRQPRGDTFDKFREERSGFDRSREERSGFDRSREERSGFDRSREDRSGLDRSRGERSGFDRSREDRSGLERSRDDRPGQDRNFGKFRERSPESQLKERPKLNLAPRTKPIDNTPPPRSENSFSDPFGGARPREEVLGLSKQENIHNLSRRMSELSIRPRNDLSSSSNDTRRDRPVETSRSEGYDARVYRDYPSRNRSPQLRNSRPPQRRSSRSPQRRSSRSPQRRSSRSPQRRSSRSPQRERSPRRRDSRSPPQSSRSPQRRTSKSPQRESSPHRRDSRSPSPLK